MSLSSQVQSSTVKDDLLKAAYKTKDERGKDLFAFLAGDLPEEQSQIQVDSYLLGLTFHSKVSMKRTESLVEMLNATRSGKAISGFVKTHSNGPVTLHVADFNKLIHNDKPLAFNSLARFSGKQLSFVVFNENIFNQNKLNDKQFTMVFVNELFDLMGRMAISEAITATSDYQALGIVLSDLVLKQELEGGNKPLSKESVLKVFTDGLNRYVRDFPGIQAVSLSTEQKSKLDELTKLSTGGTYNSFSELQSATKRA